MLNPSIEDFLEIADQSGNELELADFQISEASPFVGKKLSETGLREQGVMVVGIRRPDGERLMPPPADALLKAGDCLFAFGSARAINSVLGVGRLH
jgi:Trk K+ transport system NAD-binding subunit